MKSFFLHFGFFVSNFFLLLSIFKKKNNNFKKAEFLLKRELNEKMKLFSFLIDLLIFHLRSTSITILFSSVPPGVSAIQTYVPRL